MTASCPYCINISIKCLLVTHQHSWFVDRRKLFLHDVKECSFHRDKCLIRTIKEGHKLHLLDISGWKLMAIIPQNRKRKSINHDTLPFEQHHLTLISTWLKVFPLYTPTMDPTISGRMTMSLKWVLTTSGFSMGGASFLALRRRLRRDCCLRRKPRFSLLLWRAQYSCISCSL